RIWWCPCAGAGPGCFASGRGAEVAFVFATLRRIAMRVQVIPASAEDRATLRNLMQLYLHDFSEVLTRAPDRDGAFAYPHLDDYWRDERRKPFLITADGEVAGFALVRTISVVTRSAGVADMAEFFIVRGLRRHGVGRAAAHLLFARFPGTWEIRVIDHYAAAMA